MANVYKNRLKNSKCQKLESDHEKPLSTDGDGPLDCWLQAQNSGPPMVHLCLRHWGEKGKVYK